MHRYRPRRGATYVVVLGATLIVSALGVSGLLAVRAQGRNIDSYAHTSSARLHALSAIELGIQEIANDPNWRTTHKDDPNGIWFSNRSLGDGTFTLKVVNPSGALDRSPYDPVIFTGTGRVNGRIEQQIVEVTVVPELSPLTCLETAETAGSTISFGSTTVTALNQLISSNATGAAVSAGNAQIYANVEAVGSFIGFGNYHNSAPVSGAAERTMPDPTKVFDYYLTAGTAIDINLLPFNGGTRRLESLLLSPTSNPFGDTNAEGIYVIDCQGQAIVVSECRLVATLVLLNPADSFSSYYENQNHHGPAVANYPALMVLGDFRFRMDSSDLSESGVNYNPPGTPFPWPTGATNATTNDTFPNRLEGLIYISGDLHTQTHTTAGQFVVGGTITHQDSLSLKRNPLYFSDPPPGFLQITMVPSPGTWQQVTN